MLGNLCGDLIKGNKFIGLHPSVKKGVQLHRSIDSFTDSHKLIRKAKAIVRPEFNLFSGIVIDMFFDHFVANRHHSLKKHVKYVYDSAKAHSSDLPSSFNDKMYYMMKYNWLEMYKTSEGLRSILFQMRRRIGNKSPLNESVDILIERKEEFNVIFDEVWEDSKTTFLK
jgi:acyl carrier protein phosphodiesterase